MLNLRVIVKAIENQNQRPQNDFSLAFRSFGQSPKALESCLRTMICRFSANFVH